MYKLYLPVQWVYEVLDGGLWAPHGVKHYKIATLYAKYEQNPMITADIDTQAHIHPLDLEFI